MPRVTKKLIGHDEMPPMRPGDAEYRKAARLLYDSTMEPGPIGDMIEVSAQGTSHVVPDTQRGEKGAWVQAWVWVSEKHRDQVLREGAQSRVKPVKPAKKAKKAPVRRARKS